MGSALPGRFRVSERYLLSLNVFIGSELPLREHVAREAGVKRVTVHEARGRLIAGLDILARAWALSEQSGLSRLVMLPSLNE